jgi:putative transcriptional regulator
MSEVREYLAMNETHSLAGQLLVAMPGMQDPNFHHAVTYVCEHGDTGALGIVINRPLEMDVGEVLEQLSLQPTGNNFLSQPVMRGGPVQAERGFVMHESPRDWESTLEVGRSIYVTTSKDILSDVAAGKGPDRMLMALGYAGWDAGQLEQEIRQNAWLTVPASTNLVFDTPYERRWTAATESIGVDPSSLSLHAGHA